MFDSEFYPTPKNVIKKMLHPYLDDNYMSTMKILEPSAGKGDIVDYIDDKMNGGWSKTKIKCIESNHDLQTILQNKHYVDLVGDDFLNYHPNEYFDLIVMNPPFSNGEYHLLHAWEIMKSGDIVCLLNAETINNPYSKQRQLLKTIIEDSNGIVEHYGSCFDNAERKTNVEIVCVRLKKKEQTFFNGFFDEMKSTKEYAEKIVDDNNIVKADLLEAKIESYNATLSMFSEVVKTMRKFDNCASAIEVDVKGIFCKLVESVKISDSNKDNFEKTYQAFFNDFVDSVRTNAWKNIFRNINVGTFLTSQVKKEFNKLCDSFGIRDFTKDNIQKLIKILFDNSGTIMQQAIMEAFDLLTKYHDENRIHWEGWKTNDCWRVNKKFILPRVVELNYDGKSIKTCYYMQEKLDDLDKALCFLSGKRFSERHNTKDDEKEYIIPTYQYIDNACKKSIMKNIETEFFIVNVYKKGTAHFVFKDMWLWEQFNLVSCKGKNWLPNDFEGFGDSTSIWQGKCLEYKT